MLDGFLGLAPQQPAYTLPDSAYVFIYRLKLHTICLFGDTRHPSGSASWVGKVRARWRGCSVLFDIS